MESITVLWNAGRIDDQSHSVDKAGTIVFAFADMKSLFNLRVRNEFSCRVYINKNLVEESYCCLQVIRMLSIN